jgi:hypothetical protein
MPIYRQVPGRRQGRELVKTMPPTASRKFPVLSTRRLTLRAATPKDVPAFRARRIAGDAASAN